VAIPLLKAAPKADQVAERLEGGPWRGLELCLLPAHVADDRALAAAVETTHASIGERDLAVTAEAPVTWPSGAHVRVDRLDAEARAGIERSARFAAEIGSPVLTIHLFTPVEPARYRAGFVPTDAEVQRFLEFYADTCLEYGVTPLIENIPPVLRMRVGGTFLSPIGGHWRDLQKWRERVPPLGFTVDVSHAALFAAFAASYPTAFGLTSADGLDVGRFVEELGPGAEVAHVSDSHGLLGEGLPYGVGEVDLDPLVRRLGELVPFIVAEVNEPDNSKSSAMKEAYRRIESALRNGGGSAPRSRPRPVVPTFDWQSVLEQRDPIPSILELQDAVGDRNVLITGGGGSVGGALATFLSGFRPRAITLLDNHEPSLSADYRHRGPADRGRVGHVLCDVRDHHRLQAEFAAVRPDIVFHLAAYKHVDQAERFPEEFVDTNLQGTWNVLRSAGATGVGTVVVASTDKAALAASFYARTKRLMEELTALVARRDGAARIAVRLVNVLGSAGSASQLFLEQARAATPLTVTDPEMVRYWITMAHAVSLAGHAALLAQDGAVLAGPTDPAMLTVGDLAARIWTQAGATGEIELDLMGVRRGETMTEVLTGPGEEMADERFQGIREIRGEEAFESAAWAAERVKEDATHERARATWLEAMGRRWPP
jgi:nucleoside-diphosphate-sugar epimerase